MEYLRLGFLIFGLLVGIWMIVMADFTNELEERIEILELKREKKEG